jgi:hypothetical protein
MSAFRGWANGLLIVIAIWLAVGLILVWAVGLF